MSRAFGSRLPFLMAAALIAAALGDSIVESLSNAGIFGGSYHDDDHVSVLPTLLLGAIVVLEIVTARCFDLLRARPAGSRGWIVDLAANVSTRKPLRDFPLVFALQMAALFAMESSEQLLAVGKLLGGTAWLGGPVLASLVTHALIGWSALLLLRHVMRALLALLVSFARVAIDFISLARTREASIFICRHDEPRRNLARSARARHIGGRAPPLLPVTL
jgi:hypothetical protein